MLQPNELMVATEKTNNFLRPRNSTNPDLTLLLQEEPCCMLKGSFTIEEEGQYKIDSRKAFFASYIHFSREQQQNND